MELQPTDIGEVLKIKIEDYYSEVLKIKIDDYYVATQTVTQIQPCY